MARTAFSPTHSSTMPLTTSGVRCGRAVSAAVRMRISCSTARAHTPRASGSEMESAAFSRAGRICGRNGAASTGSSTSLLMLLTMTATIRCVAVLRTDRPRCNSGTTTARAGVSTVDTKVSDASLAMHSGIWPGSCMAATKSSTNGSTSRLSTVLHAARAATTAASITLSFMSCMASDRTRISSGRFWPTWAAAIVDSSVSHSRAATLVPVGASSCRLAMTAGIVDAATVGFTRAISLNESSASAATGLTALWRSPTSWNGRVETAEFRRYGSAARPMPFTRPVNSIMEPTRMNGFFFLLAASSMAPSMPHSTTLCMPTRPVRDTSCWTTGGSGRVFSISSSFCISHMCVSSSTLTLTSVTSAAGSTSGAAMAILKAFGGGLGARWLRSDSLCRWT
mmetsp:Transcript_127729/g.310582  ORF Transcript_127729/g.310582 Transcript_127729/m.310582 type:complete len:396 (+) Transcript_127729:2385-3572(+)